MQKVSLDSTERSISGRQKGECVAVKIVFTQLNQEIASSGVDLYHGRERLATVGPGGVATVHLPDGPQEFLVECGSYMRPLLLERSATISVRWKLLPSAEMLVEVS